MKRIATQLPSGTWRVQVLEYRDATGKRHYKSFTGRTPNEAEHAALEWKLGRVSDDPENINIYEAISRYIEIKKGVLSPSTVHSYEGMQRNYFSDKFGAIKLRDLRSNNVQIWVSDLVGDISPKTIRNAYGLLSSTLDIFAPDLKIKITLPAKKKPDLYTPSDDDVKKLLNHIQGRELEIAVLLAAFGPMRRGEICALTSSDINGNTIDINKSMVIGPDKQWHIKQPKTYSSYRKIEFPSFVIDRIRDIEGQIIKATPAQITNRFNRAITYSRLPHFRFHDLRHYSASIMHAIGIPDQYIMERGGWMTDNVMKNVYRNVIDLEATKQNKKITKHFEKLSK